MAVLYDRINDHCGNRIIGVGAGVELTDAVNVEQLNNAVFQAVKTAYHLVPLVDPDGNFITNSEGEPLVTRFYEQEQ